MNSIGDKPAENQRVLYRTGLHWAMLLGPALVIFMGGIVIDAKGSQGIALIVFGIFWGVCSSMSLQRSRIILTAEKLDIQVGFPWKRSLNIPLSEISQLNFNQPALGAMLNFGKIILVHQATKRYHFRFVSRPAALIKAVQEALDAFPHQEPPRTDEPL